MTPPSASKIDRVLSWAIVAASILGAIDAIYLYILKLTEAPWMCGPSHGCLTVNNSPYSVLYGIPVSLYGLAAYIAIMVIVLLEPKMKLAGENGPLAVFGISLGGVAFSAYLTWLEVAVIHALCPFCVTSAVLITIIFILAIVRLVRQLTH
jgi:uncharacterized membrane protein